MIPLQLSRTFATTRDRVFQAWCELDQLKEWWLRGGSIDNVNVFDCRSGGMLHYKTKSPGPVEEWEMSTYSEVCFPNILVFVHGSTNAMGEPVLSPRVPFGENWPKRIEHRVTFEDMGEHTLVTVKCRPEGGGRAAEQVFVEKSNRLVAWYNAAFDRLEDYLTHGGVAMVDSRDKFEKTQ